MHNKHKNLNNSTNINHVLIPLDALGSHTQGATSAARDGGRERSFSGQVHSCTGARVRIAVVLQGEVAPQLC